VAYRPVYRVADLVDIPVAPYPAGSPVVCLAEIRPVPVLTVPPVVLAPVLPPASDDQ